ncbi:MAG: Smr/MutS family protein, partial [Myxococcota bacterium]|nr:Smr/MutS family protein [Myxococcota bacterium]
RRDARARKAEVQERVDRLLRDPELREALQDDFVTVREGRAVVPVRAEARGRVPGIVHDASASGTTVFVEPQAVVDAGNRLREAELAAAREARRVLEALGAEVALHVDALATALGVLARLDLAFARGRLSQEMAATAPAIDDDGGRFELIQLRHPLIPADEVVPNDLRLGGPTRVRVLSGPNAGGKTVAMKALALCPLLAWAGLHVPAEAGSRIPWITRLVGDIGDAQDLRQHLSTFSAHMANLVRIVDAADAHTLAVLDEVGVGTDPAEGAALAQAVLETLADQGALVVATTHYNLLKELADADPRFENASVEFDPETLAPTYRLRHGTAGHSSATAVAARMGLHASVLERADALLAREDRRLDRLLAELSANRAAVEREREEAARLREESEAARDAYRARLERLQERRDKLVAEMRADLDAAFKDAHERVAAVIRDLQRGGGDALAAARARETLLDLEREAETVAARQRRRTPPAPSRPRVDWQRTRPGDPVRLPTGRTGTVVALPDRRGRATVQVGGARMQLEAEKLAPAGGAEGTEGAAASPRAAPRVSAPPVEAETTARLDLRGLRVEEALPRVDEALDRAARGGAGTVEIVHGLGTGALRRAVRRHLEGVPYRLRVEDAPPEQGGDGVTLVQFRG